MNSMIQAILLIVISVIIGALCDYSVIFSITSYGRLHGERLLVTSHDVVASCLDACAQHLACLTVNYHNPSKTCELLADILFHKEVTKDTGWETYGHFNDALVRCT